MKEKFHRVNALSGLYLISTDQVLLNFTAHRHSVNALSGLYLISTLLQSNQRRPGKLPCQCPLGLIPHFYQIWLTNLIHFISKCQCPLGLIPHFYAEYTYDCNESELVSMPSRAYTSFLRYPFKNLDFMRFPEPVFAGIYQNILTTAVFRAC